jgi:hypothetical protein
MGLSHLQPVLALSLDALCLVSLDLDLCSFSIHELSLSLDNLRLLVQATHGLLCLFLLLLKDWLELL